MSGIQDGPCGPFCPGRFCPGSFSGSAKEQALRDQAVLLLALHSPRGCRSSLFLPQAVLHIPVVPSLICVGARLLPVVRQQLTRVLAVLLTTWVPTGKSPNLSELQVFIC